MNYKTVITGDGSKTLYLPDLDETYHSNHGALQESLHVYIDSGLRYIVENNALEELSIFEMGFGTGLNAYLTAHFSKRFEVNVFYKSIEKFPLGKTDYSELGYYELMNDESFKDESTLISTTPWEAKSKINEFFTIEKVKHDFLAFEDDTGRYDLIYYDAFGHRAQSELWEEDPFRNCCRLLKNGGILVTYASKGSARRNLIKSGFDVEKIPGAPGKREMMRATKVL
ncbi:MAG: tRNA (5-methylaminomethyl-2-thiouridine)(34)-methyltransferase MnmD [Bacteroidota bacterium]